MDIYSIIKAPLLTEKATLAKESQNVYAFRVKLDADNPAIRSAVEALFKVEVISVKTLVQRGKMKRRGRYVGKKPNWKKALVEIKQGQSIEFFEGV